MFRVPLQTEKGFEVWLRFARTIFELIAQFRFVLGKPYIRLIHYTSGFFLSPELRKRHCHNETVLEMARLRRSAKYVKALLPI